MNVAQMERSEIWDSITPDSASLHPGYACYACSLKKKRTKANPKVK